MQLIRGKDIENYLQNSKVLFYVWNMNGQGKSLKNTGKSLKGKEFIQDKNFAPKQNERDCPMTLWCQKPLNIGNFTVSKDYLKEYKKFDKNMKKAGKWEDINVTITV